MKKKYEEKKEQIGTAVAITVTTTLVPLHHSYFPIRFSNESTLIRNPFTISPILLIFRNSFCSSSHCRSISLNVSISIVAWSTTFDARLWDACVDLKVCADSCNPGKSSAHAHPSNGLCPGRVRKIGDTR